MTATRERPPTGSKLDARLDESFGTEDELAEKIKAIMNDPARHQLVAVLPSPEPSPLYAALAAFQSEVPPIPKTKTAKVHNKEGKHLYDYRYADLADITAVVLPLLGRLGLTWTCVPTWMPLPGETQLRFVMAYRLRHVLGETIEGYWPIPDRADPQVIGSALTYARRYALCSVIGVAADEDTDGTSAKDSAARNETLDEASALSLPPAESEELAAALDPGALTPLERYPQLWQVVVRRRATGKPADPQVQEMMGATEPDQYTWSDAFGWSLATRVERLRTPTECREFWDEAAALEKAGTKLPWTWEGTSSGARLKKHGAEIADTQTRSAEALRKAIADALTLDAVESARRAIELAHEEWKIHDPVIDELHALADQREENIRADIAPEPATPPAEPAQDELGGHPLGFGDSAALLEYRIWMGAPTTTVAADLDGALERGEIEADEERMLRGMLRGRPEPADEGEGLVPWLEWRIDTARGHQQLDAVRDRVMEHVAKGRLLSGAADAPAQLLYNRITARRKVQDGQRYGGGA